MRARERPTSPKLVVLNAPASPRAEAFRVLRSRLRRTDSGRAPRSLLVTSPTGQENRHAVALNLALAMAEADEATVVIDADLQQPGFQRWFDLDNTAGLLQCLQSGTSAESALRPGPLPKLALLPAGGEVDVSASLLARPALATVLADVTAGERTAVPVGPPVMPSADAGLISARADGVVLVVSAYRTTRTAVGEAIARLEGAGAHVLGAVLDQVGGR